MLRRVAGLAFKSRPMVRSFAQLSKNDREYGGFNTNDEWMPFPREREGNDYETNWSIVEDGVVSVGDSFRLARLPLLLERIPVKVQQGALELPRPGYVGDYSLTEAGDNITHDDFEAIWKDNVEVLESGSDIFVEDQGLSASTNSRLGGRVITDDPALALILRTLLIPRPPFQTNNKSKFKGWNMDPRWQEVKRSWNSTDNCYDFEFTQTKPLPAERSIITLVAGKSNKVAVQFVEKDKVIVGAKIAIGGGAPVRSVVDAIGHANTVLVNEEHDHALALPSLALSKEGVTTLVVNAPDSLLALASADANLGNLYGAYHNILTAEGVSAVWNGFIGKAASKARELNEIRGLPTVVVNGNAALSVEPNNLAHFPAHIVFYEKGATKGPISEADAIKKLVELTSESKTELITRLVKGKKFSVAGQDGDVSL